MNVGVNMFILHTICIPNIMISGTEDTICFYDASSFGVDLRSGEYFDALSTFVINLFGWIFLFSYYCIVINCLLKQ